MSVYKAIEHFIQCLQNPTSFTQNGDPAFSTTQDARLDLFFKHFVRNGRQNDIEHSLTTSWKQYPEDTVRLILHSRDIRGGKGEKLVSFYAMMWLRKNHPLTYLLNLPQFIHVGCYKDLLQLSVMRKEHGQSLLTTDEFNGSDIELNLFSETLREDIRSYNSITEEEKLCKVSLAAKWAPSEGKHYHEEFTELCELLTDGNRKEYRQVISKLRKHLNIIERQMSLKDWESIQFSSIPSRAHKLLRDALYKHCKERYEDYMEDLKEGKEQINYKGIQPHEIVKEYLTNIINPYTAEILEQQWNSILNELKESGNFNNSIAVSDVSGSMAGTPLLVSIALGLLCAQLSSHKQIITFETEPRLSTLPQHATLEALVRQIENLPWDGSTNLRGVFQLLLDHFTPETQPKQLFIFSDMQFNCACQGKSTYEDVKIMFKKANRVLPTLIFWNLNGNIDSIPVTKKEEGVFLLSGFSTQLLKMILKNDISKLDSVGMMKLAIQKYEVKIHSNEI